MTTKNTLGKAAAVVLMAALVSACSSNAAKEEAAAQASAERAAAEQVAAAEAAAAEQRAAEKQKAMAMAEKREEKRRLMDAASAVGSVFYFDYDSSSLSDDSRAAIDAHVALMMADGGNVRLEGHTDEGEHASTTSRWVSVVLMRSATIWSRAAYQDTELKRSVMARKTPLPTALVSRAGVRIDAWRSSKAL